MSANIRTLGTLDLLHSYTRQVSAAELATAPPPESLCAGKSIAFAGFRLHAGARALSRNGEPVNVPARAMNVLIYLVLHRDRVVGRSELVEKAWPGTFVEPNNLDQAISVLRKSLWRDADGRSPIETIPRQGYRFVAAVESPEETPGAGEALEALPIRPRVLRALRWLSLAAAVLVLAAVAPGGASWRARQRPGRPGASLARKSIAVLAPRNLSGRSDYNWIATALADTLTTELSASEQFRTAPAESVARIQTELGLPAAPNFRPETLALIGRNLSADYVVTGTYLPVARQIRVDLFLQDTASGETLATLSQADDQDQFLNLVSAVGVQLRERLGARPLTTTQTNGFRAAVPSNPEAIRQYAQGKERMRLLDAPGASQYFQAGIAADPDYPLAHSALSEAWSQLGYDTRARQEATKALDLSGSLSREDRLGVEARYYRVTGMWPKALETASALWRFFPDNVDYGLMLAQMQLQSGQGKESLATVRALSRPGSPFAGDPRILLLQASIEMSLSNYAGAAATAELAAKAGVERKAYLLEAQALLKGGNALFRLGRPAEAQTKLAQARGLFDSFHDSGSVAQVMYSDAQVLLSKGELVSGKRELEQVLAASRQRDDRQRTALALLGLAEASRTEGDMAAAQKRLEEALDIARETGNEGLEARIHLNLGNILNNTGHPKDGRTDYEQAQYLAEKTGDRATLASALGSLGILDYVQGDLAIAEERFDRSLKLKREIGDRSSIGYTLGHLARVKEWQGDAEGARKLWQEACQTHEALGERDRLDGCRIDSAILAIQSGHAAEVQRELERIAASSDLPSPGTSAYRVLAESWLARGDAVEARAAIDQAQRIGKKSVNEADFLLPIAITAARVDGASGRTAAALASLAQSLRRAEELNAVNLQFEARLAMGEIEMRTGARTSGETRLAALQSDALARGFLRIARQARAALSAP
ncbi:MAG: tetratricopeptide repeat protein [Bryobacteraceae bacterium]